MNGATSRRPQVLVADDSDIIRYTLKLILEEHCDVVGEAADGVAAVDLAAELRPDVVLLDVSMPRMTGLEAARLILEQLPGIRVIIVSTHAAGAYIEEVSRIGAHGYVVKGSATVQLPIAIREALDGKDFRAA